MSKLRRKLRNAKIYRFRVWFFQIIFFGVILWTIQAIFPHNWALIIKTVF